MIFFRFIIAVILGYILWRLLRPRPGTRQDGRSGKTKTPEEMKQDPVCGTWVPVSQAVKAVHKGEAFYFCSQQCRGKFLEDHADTID